MAVPEVEAAVLDAIELDHMLRLRVVVLTEQEKLDRRGVLGEQREVHSVRVHRCAERLRPPPGDPEPWQSALPFWFASHADREPRPYASRPDRPVSEASASSKTLTR